MIPASYVLAFSVILFCIGLFMYLARASVLAMLMGLEIMLNASLFVFLAFSAWSAQPMQGQLMALFIMGVAAGEAALALALWRKVKSSS